GAGRLRGDVVARRDRDALEREPLGLVIPALEQERVTEQRGNRRPDASLVAGGEYLVRRPKLALGRPGVAREDFELAGDECASGDAEHEAELPANRLRPVGEPPALPERLGAGAEATGREMNLRDVAPDMREAEVVSQLLENGQRGLDCLP